MRDMAAFFVLGRLVFMTMKRRFAVLVTGTVLLLCLGLIYAYSILMAPLKSEFGWGVSDMTLIFALSMIAFTAGNLIAGSIMKQERVLFGFAVGVSMLAVGFVGCSFVSAETSLVLVYVLYGIVAAAGIGIIYNIVIPTVTSWFPDMCGLAQGICLMGFGAGGFLLGPLMTRLYCAVPWRAMFIALGGFYMALVAASSLLLRMPQGEVKNELTARCISTVGPGAADAVVGDMVRQRTCYLLYAFLFLVGSIGMAVTGLGRELPLSLGADEMSAAFVIGFVNIGSGLGRFLGGMALDRFGRTRSMTCIAGIAFAAPVAIFLSLTRASIPIMTLACFLSGAAWGSAVVTMPFVTRRDWGQRNMAQNMAVVNTYSIWASLVGSWGAGILVQTLGSFVPLIVTMVCFALTSLCVARCMGK